MNEGWMNEMIHLLPTHQDIFEHKLARDEQDLLEILDLELFGVKILVLILIEPFQATVILINSCLVWKKVLTFLLDSCLIRNMFWQS